MSAKRPKTYEGRAHQAFICGRITRDEFQQCCPGIMLVRGNELWRKSFGYFDRFDYIRRIAP